MAECLQSRSDYAKLEEEVGNQRRLMQSSRYSLLSEEDRQRSRVRLAELESRRDARKEKVDDVIARLVDSNSWPIGPQSEVEEGTEEKYREMIKYAEELRTTATEMNSMLNDIRKPDHPVGGVDGSPMDIDQSGGPSRPLKRRRVSEAGESGRRPTGEEAESMHDKLLNIEGRLSNLLNDLNAQDTDLMDQLDERMELKLEELLRADPSLAVPPPNPHAEKLFEIDQNIALTGEQVGELAEEVANIVIRSNAVEMEMEALKFEEERARQSFAEVSPQRRLGLSSTNPFQDASTTAEMSRPMEKG